MDKSADIGLILTCDDADDCSIKLEDDDQMMESEAPELEHGEDHQAHQETSNQLQHNPPPKQYIVQPVSLQKLSANQRAKPEDGHKKLGYHKIPADFSRMFHKKKSKCTSCMNACLCATECGKPSQKFQLSSECDGPDVSSDNTAVLHDHSYNVAAHENSFMDPEVESMDTENDQREMENLQISAEGSGSAEEDSMVRHTRKPTTVDADAEVNHDVQVDGKSADNGIQINQNPVTNDSSLTRYNRKHQDSSDETCTENEKKVTRQNSSLLDNSLVPFIEKLLEVGINQNLYDSTIADNSSDSSKLSGKTGDSRTDSSATTTTSSATHSSSHEVVAKPIMSSTISKDGDAKKKNSGKGPKHIFKHKCSVTYCKKQFCSLTGCRNHMSTHHKQNAVTSCDCNGCVKQRGETDVQEGAFICRVPCGSCNKLLHISVHQDLLCKASSITGAGSGFVCSSCGNTNKLERLTLLKWCPLDK